MAVLITGGTGFIGLSLAEALAARGRELVLFDPDPVPAPFRAAPWLAAATHAAGDVRSAADLKRALGLADIREIVHLAAVTPDRAREAAAPEGIFETNLLGTVTVMRLAAAHGGIRRIVALSSVAAYGTAETGPDGRLHEDSTPPRPESLYGISKLAAEQAALRLASLYELDVRTVRLGPVYGAWEHQTAARDLMSPHGQVVRRLAEGATRLVLPRPLRADWLYSRDAGAGLADILCSETLHSRCFNLGGGTITDVGGWCAQLQRQGFDLLWRLAEPGEEADIAIGLREDRAALSNRRLQAQTPFRPRFGLAEAAADYRRWLQACGA